MKNSSNKTNQQISKKIKMNDITQNNENKKYIKDITNTDAYYDTAEKKDTGPYVSPDHHPAAKDLFFLFVASGLQGVKLYLIQIVSVTHTE